MTSPIDHDFFMLVSTSYWRLRGESLVPTDIPAEEAAFWLYEKAPFGLLAHNVQPDPVFIYGNRTAQKLFEYSWDELSALPSRLSAGVPDQDERQSFLDQVKQHGFVDAYRGVRVAKSGRRFWIENALVWQLHDETGICYGQAALIPESSAA